MSTANDTRDPRERLQHHEIRDGVERMRRTQSSYEPAAPLSAILNPQPTRSARRAAAQTYPLGTREDVEQEDYQSPISIMLGRAWDRYRTAEQHRQSLAQEMAAMAERPAERVSSRSWWNTDTVVPVNRPPSRDVLSRREPRTTFPVRSEEEDEDEDEDEEMDYEEYEDESGSSMTDQVNLIDSQSHRPERSTTAEKNSETACKICLEQLMDTLTEPCMHVAMCHWCAEIWENNARQLRRDHPGSRYILRCPVCRTNVRTVRRIRIVF